MTEQQDATQPPGPAPGGATDAPDRAPARFRRDREHKTIGGVCAGLGRHCDMDPVIFRVVLAVLSVASGLGLIFYGFVWLFVPLDGEDENEARRMLTGRVDGPALTAVVFALVGCGLFLSMLNNGTLITSGATLALLLAGAGYWSRQRDTPDPDPLAAQAVADAPPETTAPPVPGSGPWWRDRLDKDGSPGSGTGYLWAPPDSVPGTSAAGKGPGAGAPGSAGRRPGPAGGRLISGWVTSAATAAGALATVATWEDSALTVSLQTGLAVALAIFGLGIAISAFLGRTGPGTVVLAVVTAVLLGLATALPDSITTHWLRTTWAPVSAAAVAPRYDLGTGVGTLDLRKASPAAGQTVTSNVTVGAGRLRIIVPDDVRVSLKITVALGDIQLPGEGQQDVDVSPSRSSTATLEPVRATEDPGTFALTLDVALGQAEVDRAA
ncbi:PspC domain-containing protein [Streptomyces sp. NPDC059816]|uniref:PspC domain-containing protein n=1 Tax=Streptomyces sp. NPDC059816 TaxID=3346960 RepID=UPI003646042E